MVVLIKAVQVILALSLLILVHEFGHFFFAKLSKTRVEKFYLFFNPRFSLIKFKRFGGKLHCKVLSANGGEWDEHPECTEYGIGWVPFGGYCKISGMIDETTDKEDLAGPPQPWEFRTKNLWQRFWIMFGGVFFNFILAVVLYAGILHAWGEEYLRNEDAVYGIAVNDLSAEIGFRDGDRILAIEGHEVDNFANIQIDMLRQQAREVTVLRDGEIVTVRIDENYLPAMLNTPGMFTVAVPFVVAGLMADSPNAACGLQEGDRVTAVCGEPMTLVSSIKNAFAAHAGEEIELTVMRGEESLAVPVNVDESGLIGVYLTDPMQMLTITRREYGLLEAIPAGAVKAWKTVSGYVKELGLIFTPKTGAYKSVGSFIAIGKIFPEQWDWFKFWSLCALFSIMLGVLNIIPIPGLDGGHILFLIMEAVTGRKPGDKFLQVAETIGMIFLIGLMVLAFGNDIRGLFK